MSAAPSRTSEEIRQLDSLRRLSRDKSREVEAIMRDIDKIRLEEETQDRARRYGRNNMIGGMCAIAGGAYVIGEGFRTAHPLWSPIRPLTKNNIICRLVSPLPAVGMVMAFIGAYQMPIEYRRMSDANTALGGIRASLSAKQALREGIIATAFSRKDD